jgi:hypothetical protein
MSREDSIEKIIKQLDSLQLQQRTLTARLAHLARRGSGSVPPTVPVEIRQFEIGDALLPTAPIVVRQFEVGDYVRIRNPRIFQADTGTIIRVGETRITVLTSAGAKIIRAHKHLAFE